MTDEGPEGPEGPQDAAASAPAAAPTPAPDSWRPWVTLALIAINTVVFVITVALGANPLLPDPQKMIELGGNVAPLTLGSEPWRLVSAMFLHYGIIHLAMNMLGLWSGGLLAERMYGRAGYASLYLIAGLAGGLATVSHKADVVSAGASGAIFGVFGAIGAYLLAHRDRIDTQVLGRQTRGLLFFMGYNLLYGASQKSIDMSAHLGGLAGGFVVGLALTYGSRGRHAAARIAVVTVLGLGAVVAAVTTMPVPAAGERQQAYAEFDRVQEQVTNAFNAMIGEAQAGKLTDAAFAERLEREVLPPWQALELRINQLPPPPAKLRPAHDAMVAFIAARREAWVAVDDLLRVRTTDQDHVKELQQRAEKRLTELNEALANLK